MHLQTKEFNSVISTIFKYSVALLTLIVSFHTFSEDAGKLERITPRQAGYNEKKLEELKHFLKDSGSSSMLLMYDGKIFFEWGDINHKHVIHSIRKSMLNSLVGIYNSRGLLPLDSTLKELKIDQLESQLNPIESTATFKMLLESRSGVYLGATAESEWMKSNKPIRGSHNPGEFYYYNNWDFNLVGTIFEKQTGKNIFQAFYEEIAIPIGMMHYKGIATRIKSPNDDLIPDTDGFYQYQLSESPFPAYHFRMSTYDMALYGQLFLNNGSWNGQQVIPVEWIKKSTQPISITNEKYGLAYGMMWSVLIPSKNTQRNSFYHTGNGVHMLGIYPKNKLVMVHRVDTEKSYTFKNDDLYTVIRLMHASRNNN